MIIGTLFKINNIKNIIGMSLNSGAKEEYIVRRHPLDRVCVIK